jgi:hypothetical protein
MTAAAQKGITMPAKDILLFPPTDNCLTFLVPSVPERFSIMDGYIEKRTKHDRWSDRPFSLNERATLSVLAGAIWRSNPDNFVIEEACGNKTTDSGTHRGRYDIWFLAEGKQCYGEAKQIWPCVTSPTPGVGSYPVGILRQETEAAALSKDAEDDFALGIIFAVPDISVSYVETATSSMRKYQEYLNGRLGTFASEENYHVLWGSYLRDDLLLKEAFYQSTAKGILTRPGVDVLIATKQP